MSDELSLSAITGATYVIPPDGDSDGIDRFLEQNKDRIIVAVQGLGFVGTVMSLVIANSDSDQYAVIGVDQKTADSYWKIVEINEGKLPVISSDPLVQDYFNTTQKRSNLYATYDCNAFSHADVIIVDINLDVTKIKDDNGSISSFDVPLEGFKKAMTSIGEKCKPTALVLVETTVPPGTCRKIVTPIIKECLATRGLTTNEIRIGHSYERVMPGPNYINSIKNFYRVYSGIDVTSADSVEQFLKTVISTDEYPLTRLKTTESTEMAKVLENSYRAMNISFAIEWSRFAEKSGVNLYEVIDAIRLRPTHANLMYPGIGVGGYCLTKDPLMASWASKEFFGLKDGLQCSEKAVENNDRMPEFCFEFVSNILELHRSNIVKVGLLGVAYGPGIGDTRFSPVEDFYTRILAFCGEVRCHDPYVSHWTELSIDIENSLPSFFRSEFDALIITTGHRDYVLSNGLYDLLAANDRCPLIIDTVGLLDLEKLPSTYTQNHNFFVLGVGHNKE